MFFSARNLKSTIHTARDELAGDVVHVAVAQVSQRRHQANEIVGFHVDTK